MSGSARIFAKIKSNFRLSKTGLSKPSATCAFIRPLTELRPAFSVVTIIASGSISVAKISAFGQVFAAAMARMPAPQPKSKTRLGMIDFSNNSVKIRKHPAVVP